MHELPASAWVLIVASTVPWLVLAAVHYARNAKRRSPSAPPALTPEQ